jgi:tetratricopeptide (TPR) repeat protein
VTEFHPAGTTVTGAISLLQREPLEPEVWLRLANCLRAQSDKLSSDSLDMVVEGLWELKVKSDMAAEKGEPAPELSPASSALFLRLSTSYNDPRILRKIGEIYLNEWALPAIARKHFERALFLGGPEKELKPLVEAATKAASAVPAAPRRSKTTRTKGESSQDLVKKAAQLVAKGELGQAGLLLRKANTHPLKPDRMAAAWAELGLAYFETNSYAAMEEAYLWAIQYDSNDLASLFNLGLAQHSLGKTEQAETSYLTADKIQPGDAKVWCNLGSLYFETKRYPEAEAALKKALAANPKYARAWDNLAAVLGAQNKLDEALIAVETALKLRPGYPEAYFKLGTILFAKNSFREAKEAFQRSLCVSSLIEPTKVYLTKIEAKLAG